MDIFKKITDIFSNNSETESIPAGTSSFLGKNTQKAVNSVPFLRPKDPQEQIKNEITNIFKKQTSNSTSMESKIDKGLTENQTQNDFTNIANSDTSLKPKKSITDSIRNRVLSGMFPVASQTISYLEKTPIGKKVQTGIKQSEQIILDKTLNTPFGEKVAQVASESTKGSRLFISAPTAFGKTIGDIVTGKPIRDIVTTFDEANREWDTASKEEQNSFIENVSRNLFDSGTQSVVGVLLNLIPVAGKPLATGFFTALSAQEQQEQQGKVTSATKLGIDVALDSILGGVVEKMFKKPATELLKEGFIEVSKRTAKNTGKGFLVEGLTEPAQTFLKFGDDYNRAKTDEQKKSVVEKTKEYVKNGGLLMEFLVGGLSGGFTGGGASLISEQKTVKSLSKSDDSSFNPKQNTLRESMRENIKNDIQSKSKEEVALELNAETGIPVKIATDMIDQVIQSESITTTENVSGDTVSKEQIKAEITNIFNKATATDINVPTKTKPEAVLKTVENEEPLINEAKKYKSAEEFVKAQGTPVYHGTNADFVEFKKEFRGTNTGKTPTNMESISFTDNPGVAETFGKNVKEAYLDIKNPKIIDVGGVSYSEPYKNYNKFKFFLNDLIESIDKNKYDSIILKNYNDAGKGEYKLSNHTIVFDEATIKTKSQLEDIWNKASGTKQENKGPAEAFKVKPKTTLFSRTIKITPQEAREAIKESLARNKISIDDVNLLFPEFEKGNDILGSFQKNHRLYGDLITLYERKGKIGLGTALHESKHFLISRMPESLRNELFNQAKKDITPMKRKMLENAYKDMGSKYTGKNLEDGIIEEYIVDKWTRSDLKDFYGQNKSIWERAFEFLDNLLAKIVKVYKNISEWYKNLPNKQGGFIRVSNERKPISEADKLIMEGKIRIISREGKDVYQIKKGGEWLTTLNEDSAVRQLTGEKTQKIALAEAELPQKLQEKGLMLEIRGDAIANNPLNALWKYANKRDGTLPEVGGDNGIFGKTGDDIIAREEFLRFGKNGEYPDTETIRNEFSKFVQEKREYKEDLKQFIRDKKQYFNKELDIKKDAVSTVYKKVFDPITENIPKLENQLQREKQSLDVYNNNPMAFEKAYGLERVNTVKAKIEALNIRLTDAKKAQKEGFVIKKERSISPSKIKLSEELSTMEKEISLKKELLNKPDYNATQTEKQNLREMERNFRELKREYITNERDRIALNNIIQREDKLNILANVEKILREEGRNRKQKFDAITDYFKLTDKEISKIKKGVDIRLLSDKEFEDLLRKTQGMAYDIATKNNAVNQVKFTIEMNQFKKVENLQQAMKLPKLENMTISQLEEFHNLLNSFEFGDEFLGVRQLETIINTDISNIKTKREAIEDLVKRVKQNPKYASLTVSDFNKFEIAELDRFRYDTALARRSPFFDIMVHDTNEAKVASGLRFFEFKKDIESKIKLARNSRKRTLGDIIAPTDDKIFSWLESDKDNKVLIEKTMTKEEIDVAEFIQEKYASARDYLLNQGALKNYRSDYITHIRRSFLEAIIKGEPGVNTHAFNRLKMAFKEMFDTYKQDEAIFNILNQKTGQILPLEKFFQFSIKRSGNLVPTRNVAQAVLKYFETFEKKKALDALIPKIDIYAHSLSPTKTTPRGLELDPSIKIFVKEWLNTKKGRVTDSGIKPGGKIDWTIRTVVALTRIRDLAINIPVGVASNFGAQVASFTQLGPKNYTIGINRSFTKTGKDIVKKYESFVGENFLARMGDLSKGIEDKFLEASFGLFSTADRQARIQYFLGNLTKEEFNSGIISTSRLADMKTNMGRYLPTDGDESIMGKTATGKAVTQYKGWAVQILATTADNLKQVSKMIGSKDFKGATKSKEFSELLRGTISTAIIGIIAYGAYSELRDRKDKTFLENLAYKSMNDALSLIGALDPSLWTQTPRAVQFVGDLGKSISNILVSLSTGDRNKDGDIKGLNELGKIVTPSIVKTLLPQDKEDKTKSEVRKVYDQVQTLKEEGREDEALKLVKEAFPNTPEGDAGYEIYKKIKTAEKTKKTNERKEELLPLVEKVYKLKEKGSLEEAQALVDELSDEDYELYQRVKKENPQDGSKPEYKAGEGVSENSVIKSVITYAEAIGTNPVTAFNRIFTGQKIRRVDNGAIIVERMPLEKSEKVKSDRGATENMRLDHTIPLQLGGSNSKNNLKLVDTSVWSSYTPVENYLGKKLRDNKVSKKEAQNLILRFKNNEISFEDIKNSVE
jgi:hypothetical protein